MNNLLPIGQFSRMCSLTIKALRHYDDVGLLHPARIDAATGYRYYTLAQMTDARRIVLLRSLDMPLEEVAAYLAAADAETRRAVLSRHRQRTMQKLDDCRQALSLLENLIHGEPEMPYEISEKQVSGRPVASVRLHTSIERIAADFQSVFQEVFPFIARQGVRCVGAPVAVYHDPEFNKEDIDLEICIPVDRAPSAGGRVAPNVLPAAKVAWTTHTGPYDNLHAAYAAMGAWIGQNNRQCAGPVREVYLVGPGMAPDPSGYRTEIQWPVV